MDTNDLIGTENRASATTTSSAAAGAAAPYFSEQFNTMREEFNARFDALEAAGKQEPAPSPQDEDDLEKSSPAVAGSPRIE